MPNYKASVCLTKLDGAQLQTGADGKVYCCIPIEEADLYLSQTTNQVYLNLSLWEARNGINERGETHAIKQSLSQARREMLGEAAKTKPYLGNVKILAYGNAATPAPNPNTVYSQPVAPAGYAPIPGTPATTKSDDLVF